MVPIPAPHIRQLQPNIAERETYHKPNVKTKATSPMPSEVLGSCEWEFSLSTSDYAERGSFTCRLHCRLCNLFHFHPKEATISCFPLSLARKHEQRFTKEMACWKRLSWLGSGFREVGRKSDSDLPSESYFWQIFIIYVFISLQHSVYIYYFRWMTSFGGSTWSMSFSTLNDSEGQSLVQASL